MAKYKINYQTGGSVFKKPEIPAFAQGRESTNLKRDPLQTLAEIKKKEQLRKFNEMNANAGDLKEISKKEFVKSQGTSISEVLLNPVTAATRVLHNQDLNRGFSNDRNIFDTATDIVNPATYIRAAYNTAGNLLHPINTAKSLGKGAINLATNMVDGQNFFNDGSNEEALGILGDAGIAATIPSLSRNVLNVADRQFSKTGAMLDRVKFRGESAGLDPHAIAKNQMETVGITSNQRQAYVPGVSDFFNKYVTPYNYAGNGSESKISQTINNIKAGGIPKGLNKARTDAWNLYLGKPQLKNTFSLAETAPVNHPAYPTGSLNGMDVYSINSLKNKASLIDFSDNHASMDMLSNKITYGVDDAAGVMGGYNRLLSKEGLQYNDIWDLNPSITPANFVPRKLSESKLGERLLYRKTNYPDAEGNVIEGSLPRSFKFDIGKLYGKPFMSHDNLPDFTSQDLHNHLSDYANSKIEKFSKLLKKPANAFDNNFYKNNLESAEFLKNQIGETPKFQYGGDNQYSDTSIFNLISKYAAQPEQTEEETDTEDAAETTASNEESDFQYSNEDFKSLQEKYDALEERVNKLNNIDYQGSDDFMSFLFDDFNDNSPLDFNQINNRKSQYRSNLSAPPRPTGTTSGNFQSFSSPEEGRAALERQLDLYKTGASRNTTGNETLYEAMAIYAPASDNNNPKHYAEFIAKKIGVDPNTPIRNIDTKKWADAVTIMEGNTKGNNPGNLRPYQMGGAVFQKPNVPKYIGNDSMGVGLAPISKPNKLPAPDPLRVYKNKKQTEELKKLYYYDVNDPKKDLDTAGYLSGAQMLDENGRPDLFVGNTNRSHFNPFNNSINLQIPDQEFLISEIAHAKQKNDGQYLANRWAQDWFNNPSFTSKQYQKNYSEPGTLEFEAHNDYEGSLWKRYSDLVKKNNGFQNGGDVSRQGYNFDSPYRNEPYLDIHTPTGEITMENTPHPLLGIGQNGEQKLMLPGKKYKFDSKIVKEIKL